jgi:hypothetical protein
VGGRVIDVSSLPFSLWGAEVADTLGPFQQVGGSIWSVNAYEGSKGGYDPSLDALILQPTATDHPPLAFHFDRGASPPVPVASAHVLEDRIALRWTAAPGAQFELSRRAGAGAWTHLASLVVSTTGELAYDDHAIEAGQGYGYRLGASETPDVPATADVWVIASISPSFSLGLAWPNPAHDRVSLSFTLPAQVPATLDVMDIAGRRVWSQRLQGLGPGPHVVSLDRASIARAGLYFARLTQSGRSRTTRVVWVP